MESEIEIKHQINLHSFITRINCDSIRNQQVRVNFPLSLYSRTEINKLGKQNNYRTIGGDPKETPTSTGLSQQFNRCNTGSSLWLLIVLVVCRKQNLIELSPTLISRSDHTYARLAIISILVLSNRMAVLKYPTAFVTCDFNLYIHMQVVHVNRLTVQVKEGISRYLKVH